jgi:hypothetical protein
MRRIGRSAVVAMLQNAEATRAAGSDKSSYGKWHGSISRLAGR